MRAYKYAAGVLLERDKLPFVHFGTYALAEIVGSLFSDEFLVSDGRGTLSLVTSFGDKDLVVILPLLVVRWKDFFRFSDVVVLFEGETRDPIIDFVDGLSEGVEAGEAVRNTVAGPLLVLDLEVEFRETESPSHEATGPLSRSQ